MPGGGKRELKQLKHAAKICVKNGGKRPTVRANSEVIRTSSGYRLSPFADHTPLASNPQNRASGWSTPSLEESMSHTWFVTFEVQRRGVLPERRSPRATVTFETEAEAKGFARTKLNEGLVMEGMRPCHRRRKLRSRSA